MPIWIKLILFCWFGLTPVGYVSFRMWCAEHPLEVMSKKFPGWVLGFGMLFILDVLAVLPVVFWLIFLR